MAILSTLLAVNEPSGFWVTIIRAFEAVTNNYVLAIIFLTVVIRIIWGLIDTYSKYNQQKMNAVQVKMQPELERIKAKYANSPQVLNQKQNEVYRRYYGKSYYTGCFVMLIIMVLNLVIFITLFTGLNSMASYNIDRSYNNLKFDYANAINVIDDYFDGNYQDQSKYEIFENYQNLGFVYEVDQDNNKTISLVSFQVDGQGQFILGENEQKVIDQVIWESEYKTDFSYVDVTTTTDGTSQTISQKAVTTNDYIISIINKIFPSYEEGEEQGSKEIILIENWHPLTDENGNALTDKQGQTLYQDLYLSTAVQNVCMQFVVEGYDLNKDSFLWIENIWIADSPTIQSIMSYDSLVGQIGSDNVEYGEETVYNAFMPDLQEERDRVNGYYILPILCVLFASLSIILNRFYAKRKNRKEGKDVQVQGGAKWMQIIIPILLGIFALFYNSVFAIYMLTGQVVSTLLLPLQLFIVDKLVDKNKKKEENNTVVDYSRKF